MFMSMMEKNHIMNELPSLTGETLTTLTNSQRFVKVIPSNIFPINNFPMKPTINSSKFNSSNVHAHTICQNFTPSNFYAISC